MARLENKVSLVVGGGQSLGEAIVRRFAAEGSRVVVADLNGEAANAVVEEVRSSGGEATARVAVEGRGCPCAPGCCRRAAGW